MYVQLVGLYLTFRLHCMHAWLLVSRLSLSFSSSSRSISLAMYVATVAIDMYLAVVENHTSSI